MNKLNPLNKEEKKVREFFHKLGDVEYRGETFVDYDYNLSGYQYYGRYQSIYFTLYVTYEDGIYIRVNTKNSEETKEFLSKLSDVFGINLDKLKFSIINFHMFKLDQLPEEIINLPSNNDEIHLFTKNNRIYVDIRDNIDLVYDKETKKFTILGIKNWETYNKIRSMIDEDIREALDKLSISKPEFLFEAKEGDLVELMSNRKENILTFLNKLTPISEKLKKIDINDNQVLVNNLLVELKDGNWEINIPLKEFEKLLDLDISVDVYKDFWVIKVYRGYLTKITKALNIESEYITHTKKLSPYFDPTEKYYVFIRPVEEDNNYYIVSSDNIEKFLLSLGVNVEKQNIINDSFELSENNSTYKIIKGEKDELHIKLYKENKFLTSLKTYLWYFGVDNFEDLKKLDKEKIIDTLNRQLNEDYFYPMSFYQVKKYIKNLLKHTIHLIDETINEVTTQSLDFTSSIKSLVSIDCIFDKDCTVNLELESGFGEVNTYYSLIGTSKGHMPVPIFLDYIYPIRKMSDEEQINVVKNILYSIKGYGNIPQTERDYDDSDTNVRGASSPLFQEAIVLYNKLRKGETDETEENKENEDYVYQCPNGTLSDGIGYCREFDYKELMKKPIDELTNDILESLLKMRKKFGEIKKSFLSIINK
jgi:hypothetical protein